MGKRPRVVIIGAGFGGLWAAKALGSEDVDVTVIDRKNHHTFQPLLYQVATAVLSPGEIASPIRRILNKHKNIKVILGEVAGFVSDKKEIRLEDGTSIGYDYLIVAAGARHSYFGNDDWEIAAPGLKTIEDAVEMRSRILLAFEVAEREAYFTGSAEPLTFVIVGAGPTGVELAGAIADIARKVLSYDFTEIDTRRSRVLLFEGSDRVLGTFPPDLSEKAKQQLEDLGVEVHLNSFVKDIEPARVKVGENWINCDVVLWATGVAASPLGKALGTETDRAGRVVVEPDLTIPGRRDIFVIGDMASIKRENGEPVPGVSPAAMQMGTNAAENILRDIKNKERVNFSYIDRGSMATIGKRKAIANIKGWKFSGFPAWIAWLFLHVIFLIGFKNRIAVLADWFWAYVARGQSARLVTGNADQLRDALEFMLPDTAARMYAEIDKQKEIQKKPK